MLHEVEARLHLSRQPYLEAIFLSLPSYFVPHDMKDLSCFYWNQLQQALWKGWDQALSEALGKVGLTNLLLNWMNWGT